MAALFHAFSNLSPKFAAKNMTESNFIPNNGVFITPFSNGIHSLRDDPNIFQLRANCSK